MIVTILLVYEIKTIPTVYAQVKENEITAEEKKAANELATRFILRLNETGDVEPLIKEMFVSDFMNRYVKEILAQIRNGDRSEDRILFTSGLEYNSRLLKDGTEYDWRTLYVTTFNLMNYGFSYMVNEGAKSKAASGQAMDDDQMDRLLGKMYPPAVTKLLNSNRLLRNMLEGVRDAPSLDVGPIKNVEELREANKVLANVNRILIGRPEGKLTVESQAFLKRTIEKLGDESIPKVEICDRECYGFAPGTRVINLFATPMHALIIVKVVGEYRILIASPSSPD